MLVELIVTRRLHYLLYTGLNIERARDTVRLDIGIDKFYTVCTYKYIIGTTAIL